MPSPLGSNKRIRNPFFDEHIWPKFLRKRHRTLGQSPTYRATSLPLIDYNKETAYLRPEASWRRMLTQQPPTNYIGVIEYSGSGIHSVTPVYTRVKVLKPNNDDYLRITDVVPPVLNYGRLMPGEDKGALCFEARYSGLLERQLQDERAVDVSAYLGDVGFVIFTRYLSLSSVPDWKDGLARMLFLLERVWSDPDNDWWRPVLQYD
ncbi:hypothetical protein SI65_04246 [Aspergillus cristatus]|uniref:Uncharacterized protein n=1 Tax=Aspergillus cristatus TaxID=573508 RepID=A0A1E3BJM9_ASPCR|nr:hypothetical protein SI65_04246 [Aspergillus cristatus]